MIHTSPTRSGFTMTPVLILVILIVLVGGGYYVFQQNQSDLELQGTTNPPPPPGANGQANNNDSDTTTIDADVAVDSDVVIELSGQNNSDQDGMVQIYDENGKAHVVLELGATEEGMTQPAHIHVGSCAKIGAVKYPLANVVDGESETTLSISTAELMKLLPLAINVHKSVSEAGVYVACGDIVMVNTGTL